FALAHLTRTPIRLLTAALGIVVVFGFLWTPALSATGPWVGAGPGTPGASVLNFDGQMVDPVLAPSTLVSPALWGLGPATVLGVVVTLTAWIAVPVVWALQGARRGD
ncbi:MAG TPA: hypothetical protein VMH90_00850, partial [Thermoplasmata archaeon]|nr:hypothetical protein [Thermoplasmata archaeon]